jgi:hypothetical protein
MAERVQEGDLVAAAQRLDQGRLAQRTAVAGHHPLALDVGRGERHPRAVALDQPDARRNGALPGRRIAHRDEVAARGGVGERGHRRGGVPPRLVGAGRHVKDAHLRAGQRVVAVPRLKRVRDAPARDRQARDPSVGARQQRRRPVEREQPQFRRWLDEPLRAVALVLQPVDPHRVAGRLGRGPPFGDGHQPVVVEPAHRGDGCFSFAAQRRSGWLPVALHHVGAGRAVAGGDERDAAAVWGEHRGGVRPRPGVGERGGPRAGHGQQP